MVSQEAEPLRCGQCQDALNVLGHLEENAECRYAAMRENLPQISWTAKYSDDTDLLILDLSLTLNCCLNTGGCVLQNGVIQAHSRHFSDSPDCFEFYKSVPVLVELNAKTDTPANLSQWLRNRRGKIREKKSREGESFLQKMDRELKNRCLKCGLQGPVGWKFEVKAETRGAVRMVCKKPVCEDEARLIDLHPNTLSIARGDASKVRGQEDHLVAVRVDARDACLFMPVQADRQNRSIRPDEQIEGMKTLVVGVPKTQNAMRLLENASKRAEKDWQNLKSLAEATLAPRTMHLGNFGHFIHAVSMLHRVLLAAFRRSCLDKITQLKNAAAGPISSRSPKKTDATYLRPKFADVEPQAVQDTMPWSESAQAARLAESEARSACNGKIKTKVRIRLLADDTDLWSDKLKAIIAKSFGRDISRTGTARTVTCEGGCNPASCGESHPDLNMFLSEEMSGLARLARIPLVLNYLKAKVMSFEKAILQPECSQYDFRIEWDKFSWNVHLTGHMWSKTRQTLNEKVARNWYPGDIGIVRRVLVRPEVLETVSFDQGHLERR